MMFGMRDAVATAQPLRLVARAVTEWERGFCCVGYVRCWVCCALNLALAGRLIRNNLAHAIVNKVFIFKLRIYCYGYIKSRFFFVRKYFS